MTTPHASPFYCPYCGEEDIEPFGEDAGRFHCNACDRHFTLRFVGVGATPRETP